MGYFTSLCQMPFIIVLTLTLLVIGGCKDKNVNPTNTTETPPGIPPASSLELDFGSFPSTKPIVGKDIRTSPKMLARANWGFAALNVGIWQTLVTLGMIIPVAAFKASFTQEPELVDGNWVWSQTFTPPGGVPHTSELHAEVGLSGINWKMFISKEGEFTDFLWYTGTSNLLQTEGTWTLNKTPQDSIPWIGIEWSRNISVGTAQIKYTNIIPGAAGNGGYISYGTTTDSTHNTFYDIFNQQNNNLTSIKWHRTTRAGEVVDSRHFGDSNGHCWDENLDDTVCP